MWICFFLFSSGYHFGKVIAFLFFLLTLVAILQVIGLSLLGPVGGFVIGRLADLLAGKFMGRLAKNC